MIKKIVSMALASVLALSVLCSCNGGGKTSSTASSPDKSSSDAASTTTFTPTYPIVESPITVKAWVVGKDMTNPRLLWSEDLYNLTNIKVEFSNIESDAFNAALSGDDWPDFFAVGFNKAQRNEFGALGHKLVNYLDKLEIMPYLAKFMEEYPVSKQALLSNDGGMYGLFRYEEGPGLSMARMHYNAEFLEKNNIAAPETLDEFYEVLKKCKELNGGAAPLVTNLNQTWGYYGAAMFPAFGELNGFGRTLDANDNVVNADISDQYREYLKYVAKLYKEGLLHQEYMTLDTNSMSSLVQQGSGIFFAECALGLPIDTFTDGKWHIGTLKPLVAKKGDTPVAPEYEAVKADGTFPINAASKYVDEICRMLDTQFSKDEVKEGSGINGLAWNYGKSDTVFHIDEKTNTYTLTTRDGSVDDYNTDWLTKNVIYDWAGVQFIMQYAPATESNTKNRLEGYINNLLPYCTGKILHSGWLTFTDEEQDTLDSYSTDYDNYVNQSRAQFITDTEGMDINDDEVWKKYVDTVKSLHDDDLNKVYQDAYTRFSSTK